MTEKRRHSRHFVEGMGIYAKTTFNTEVEILDISASGCSIRGTKRFNMGVEYSFKFEHKDRVINLKGIVLWEKLTEIKKIGEGEAMPIYTAGVEFRDVETDKSRQLKDFLIYKFEELRERRLGSIRVKILTAEKAVLGYMETCVVRDISEGGIRVETAQEPTVETIFPMELVLQENENPIQCKGRVAFCSQMGETPKRYAMGVELMDISDEDKDRLRRFIKALP